MSFAAGEEEELAAALRVITAIATLLYLVAYFTALAALGWVVLVEALPLPYRAFGVGKSSQSPDLIDRRLCCLNRSQALLPAFSDSRPRSAG